MATVLVLKYGHVAPDRELTPAGFEAQLKWLKANGYHSLSGSQLEAHMSGREPAPADSLLLTFDTGFADSWVYVFPLLMKYEMRAVIFVVTARMMNVGIKRRMSFEGGEIQDSVYGELEPKGFLDWCEIKEMVKSGLVEVGSHTHTHKSFQRGNGYEDIGMELSESKEHIEKNVGLWTGQISWPWGDFSDEWLASLEGKGYRMAYTSKRGANQGGGDTLRIRRLEVVKDDLRWFAGRVSRYNRNFSASLYGFLYDISPALAALLGG